MIYNDVLEIDEPRKLIFRKHTNDAAFKFIKNQAFAYFNFDKLLFPLKLRRWKKGDRFVPFGMSGSKLVSDFLIDEKVSLFEKENVWVLLSDEKIIWLVGYRASNMFKIKPDTKTILEVSMET